MKKLTVPTIGLPLGLLILSNLEDRPVGLEFGLRVSGLEDKDPSRGLLLAEGPGEVSRLRSPRLCPL